MHSRPRAALTTNSLRTPRLQLVEGARQCTSPPAPNVGFGTRANLRRNARHFLISLCIDVLLSVLSPDLPGDLQAASAVIIVKLSHPSDVLSRARRRRDEALAARRRSFAVPPPFFDEEVTKPPSISDTRGQSAPQTCSCHAGSNVLISFRKAPFPGAPNECQTCHLPTVTPGRYVGKHRSINDSLERRAIT